MEHLNKFAALSGKDKFLILPVAGGIFIARFLLWTTPYKIVLRIHKWTYETFARRSGKAPDQAEYTDRIVLIVKGIGRRVLGSKPCLPQALVTLWFLKRNHIDSTLRIGVNKDRSGALVAHAWIESEGNVVIGGQLSKYRYARIEPVIEG